MSDLESVLREPGWQCLLREELRVYVVEPRGMDGEAIVMRPGAAWPVWPVWDNVRRWPEESQLP